VAVFEPDPDGIERLDKTAPRNPQSMYGLTKFVVERLGRTYSEQGDLEFAALEPVHGLGPDRRRGNVEDAYLIKAAVAGIPLTVPRVDQPIEVIYVGDEASAFIDVTLADTLEHDCFVVGTGEQVTLAELVEFLNASVSGAELEVGERRGDDVLASLPPSDTTRLHEATGWQPTRGVTETVETYIDWLRANPQSWIFDPTEVPWPTN
jgi:UDP-glucose 4-epimerase